MSYRNALLTLAGDLHYVNGFPWFSYAHRKHKVHMDEILEALKLVTHGDVGLHRDSGYLSNLFIPGFMKHAWIHTKDQHHPTDPNTIVEAISEGVVERNAVYPLLSDYSVILEPLGVTDEDRKGACLKATRIVGESYDFDFEFDIEAELKFYKGGDKQTAAHDMSDMQDGLQKKHAFSCTEVASYAWWHRREDLGLYRTRRFGQTYITADCFMRRGWKIKWASESTTVDAARKLGLHEEGMSLVEDYWR